MIFSDWGIFYSFLDDLMATLGLRLPLPGFAQGPKSNQYFYSLGLGYLNLPIVIPTCNSLDIKTGK